MRLMMYTRVCWRRPAAKVRAEEIGFLTRRTVQNLVAALLLLTVSILAATWDRQEACSPLTTGRRVDSRGHHAGGPR